MGIIENTEITLSHIVFPLYLKAGGATRPVYITAYLKILKCYFNIFNVLCNENCNSFANCMWYIVFELYNIYTILTLYYLLYVDLCHPHKSIYELSLIIKHTPNKKRILHWKDYNNITLCDIGSTGNSVTTLLHPYSVHCVV